MQGKIKGFWRKFALCVADIAVITVAAILAHWDRLLALELDLSLWIWFAANVATSITVLALFGLYDIIFNSVGLPEILKTVLAAVVIGVANILFATLTLERFVTLKSLFTYIAVWFCGCVGVRAYKRFITAIKFYISKADKNTKKIRVMVVGGGDAGTTLIKEMLLSDKISYQPVCVIDDAPEKIGKSVNGVRVVGTTNDIPMAVEKYDVKEIFVALPTVSKKRVSEIVTICKNSCKTVKILPGIYQLALGQVTIAKFREVDVQDLLGRDQVGVNLDEIMGYIENKRVLVTGGGGSIGSELCRQIATHNPETLIILDIYENNAYEIEQELKRKHPAMNLLTLIASVRDKRKMRDVFEKYRPQIVFHAAAHKHVPLMETSPNEAVKNNVFGTLNVARCADEYGVETFVQISTDKAVNPTNIMGATKRICEMIVQCIGRHSQNTKFVAVRFGNVLGSNGSVIPLFKKQIAEGGPVTVTHKDIIRYFMTIPEAVSLVLQAGAYAKGGQIFVLDMGEPVRIYDLAYNLIKLSGYVPNVDIPIVCTGLRPGEKLYEERLMEEEGLQKTPNGLINIARPIDLDEAHLWQTLERMENEVLEESETMKKSVKELVPTYTIDKRDSIAEALHRATNRAKTDFVTNERQA